jgi:hypothetical protein
MVAASEQSPTSPRGAEVPGGPTLWSVLPRERLAHLNVGSDLPASQRGVVVRHAEMALNDAVGIFDGYPILPAFQGFVVVSDECKGVYY